MCLFAFHRGRRRGRRGLHRFFEAAALFVTIVAIVRRAVAVLSETRRELEEIAYRRSGGAPPGSSIMRRENDYHHVS